jgi:hypothetical protein
MGMPGFTAEASMYQTNGHYRLVATWVTSTGEDRIFLARKYCLTCVPDPDPPDVGPFTGCSQYCCDPDNPDNCYLESCTGCTPNMRPVYRHSNLF